MCFWLNFVIKFIVKVPIIFIGYIWIVYIIAANFAVLDTFSMNINDIFNQIFVINNAKSQQIPFCKIHLICQFTNCILIYFVPLAFTCNNIIFNNNYGYAFTYYYVRILIMNQQSQLKNIIKSFKKKWFDIESHDSTTNTSDNNNQVDVTLALPTYLLYNTTYDANNYVQTIPTSSCIVFQSEATAHTLCQRQTSPCCRVQKISFLEKRFCNIVPSMSPFTNR